jgi:hypothetical protein
MFEPNEVQLSSTLAGLSLMRWRDRARQLEAYFRTPRHQGYSTHQ